MVVTYDPVPRTATCGDTIVQLTRTQGEIFTALAASPARFVARTTLYGRLWSDSDTAEKTLDVHMLKLRARIATLPLTISTIWGRGYRLNGEIFVVGGAAAGAVVTMTPAGRKVVLELLETHPNAALVSRAYAALGGL